MPGNFVHHIFLGASIKTKEKVKPNRHCPYCDLWTNDFKCHLIRRYSSESEVKPLILKKMGHKEEKEYVGKSLKQAIHENFKGIRKGEELIPMRKQSTGFSQL